MLSPTRTYKATGDAQGGRTLVNACVLAIRQDGDYFSRRAIRKVTDNRLCVGPSTRGEDNDACRTRRAC